MKNRKNKNGFLFVEFLLFLGVITVAIYLARYLATMVISQIQSSYTNQMIRSICISDDELCEIKIGDINVKFKREKIDDKFVMKTEAIDENTKAFKLLSKCTLCKEDNKKFTCKYDIMVD